VGTSSRPRSARRWAYPGSSTLREFIREQTVRAERVTDRQLNALDALVLRQHEGVAALRDMRTEIREVRDERKAQTEALLKVIDRL